LFGYKKLLAELHKRGERIPVAIECKEHLVIRILTAHGYPVYPINPKSADRYKDRYQVSGMKTDEIDAFSLADILRTDIHKHKPLIYSSGDIQKLQILSNEYEKLLKDKNILEGQFQDVLNTYFPVMLTLFFTNNCKILYRLIPQVPTYKQLRALSLSEFTLLLRNNRYNLTQRIKPLYDKIQQSDYHSEDLFDETYSQTAIALCEAILLLDRHLKSILKQMMQITHSHRLGEIFASIPGSGKIMSAKLLALMGDNKSAYKNAAEVQAYSGVAPMLKQSGKKFRVVFRFSCNKYFRDILTWFSYCSMQWCPWARAFYDRKRLEGKRHFEACRLLAFKWLRIIYVLWNREELYDERIHSGNVARYYRQNIKSA
jgi:transposase